MLPYHPCARMLVQTRENSSALKQNFWVVEYENVKEYKRVQNCFPKWLNQLIALQPGSIFCNFPVPTEVFIQRDIMVKSII